MEGRRGGGADARGRRLRARERERRRREVRRRRLGALACAAALAAVAGAALGAGGGEETDPKPVSVLPPECSGTGAAGLRALAGTRIIVGTDGTPDKDLLARAKAGAIAGVIVFPGTGETDEEVRAGMKELQAAAAAGGQEPLVIATDQEGGPVKRFVSGPPLRSPYDLGRFGTPSDSRLEARATANYLTKLGINVDLAPVLDVPASTDSVIAIRAFGTDAAGVSEKGLAFANGLQQEGVMATAKHFPGLGRSVLNTDFAPSEISASRRDLAGDLRPFQAAIDDDVALVMVSSASYPGLGGHAPAALEAGVADGLLRDRLGFRGVSITDDLEAEAIASSDDRAEAAERAAAAGMDLLLFARTPAPDVLDHLTRALTTGRLEVPAAQDSCVRVVALRARLGQAPVTAPAP